MQRIAPLHLSDLGQDSRSKGNPALALPGWMVPAWIVGIVVAGAALRLVWVFQVGLHPDEALYASWALRIADGSDPALLRVFVDKPPLLPYLLAAVAWLMGNAPATVGQLQLFVVAGRLAAVGAGMASLALLWSLARPVYGRPVAALAVALLAISPLAARLSPSLLTDPWLVLWMLLGLWAAQRRRPWLTGVACGLAYATKQQALLILPLLVGAFLLFQAEPGARRGALWRLFCGFALLAVIVLWWDSLRWQWMPSYWERSATTYGGLALISPSQLGSQLAGWTVNLATALGWPLLLLAVILWSARLGVTIRARRRGPAYPAAPAALPARFDALLGFFLAGYLILHLATSIAPWDRYALPLAPVLALLLARVIVWWADRFAARGRRQATVALAAAVVAGSLWAMTVAASPRFPVADHATYDGAPALAQYIRSREPATSVVYHRWYGWHYGFYLYGTDLDLRWWQSPEDLARLAGAERDRRQLLAIPVAEDRAAVEAALAQSGLALAPVMTATHPDGSPSATLFSIVLANRVASGD